jgi:hypothetical protein
MPIGFESLNGSAAVFITEKREYIDLFMVSA